MQRYTVYLYLETALHVSGGTSTHHQERIQLYLQHQVFVTPLLLSAAIVEELEPVWVCCGWRTPPTAHVYWNILKMHEPINVKSPNNTSKWQMGFNSAFKGLKKWVWQQSSHFIHLWIVVYSYEFIRIDPWSPYRNCEWRRFMGSASYLKQWSV
jgi:hypothetical protein